MPVQRRRRQTGRFANARRCWRTSGRATPSLRCASSGTFSSDCCTIPTPDSRTPKGSLLDAKGGHDWKRFDNPAKGLEHGAVLAGDFKLVHGLPPEKDRRRVIPAVVRIDLIGMFGTKPDAVRNTAKLIWRQVAASARAALCGGKDMTPPSRILILLRLLCPTDRPSALTFPVSAATAGAQRYDALGLSFEIKSRLTHRRHPLRHRSMTHHRPGWRALQLPPSWLP